MNNFIISLLVGHLIRELEIGIKEEVPQGVDFLKKEIDLLIVKLEHLVKQNYPGLSSKINPVIEQIGGAAEQGIEAVGEALVQ